MMPAGQDIETKLGRQNRIRWFEADVTKSVTEQANLEKEGYDIVMANWVFDHATSISELRSMYENVVKNLKPGGRFIGVRAKSIRAEYMSYGKYGVTFTDVAEIPGGLRYQVNCVTEPPFSFEATSMESTYSISDDIGKELGLVEIQLAPAEDTEIFNNNR